MNDFTKEELEDLHYFTYRYHQFNEFFQPTEFLNKIQRMIDSYDVKVPSHYHCAFCGENTVLDDFACPQCDAQGWEGEQNDE